MDSSGAQEISRVGPDGWAWASSPGAFTVPASVVQAAPHSLPCTCWGDLSKHCLQPREN